MPQTVVLILTNRNIMCMSRYISDTLTFSTKIYYISVCEICIIVIITYVIQTGAVHTEFYKDSDLTVGAVVNVWGRKFLVCDCDDFTKEYFRTKYGMGELTPIFKLSNY